jgi:cytochrome c peroxidase
MKRSSKKVYAVLILFLFALSLLSRCEKDELEGSKGGEGRNYADPEPKELDVPSHFPSPELPDENPLTEEGLALGRKLYYDPLLSKGGPFDGSSCSSCHQQKDAFTVPRPEGRTPVLPHINLAWGDRFLWNGKVDGDLEEVMAFEVEEFFRTDIEKLRNDPDYPDLFGKAFGEPGVSLKKTEKALAQFIRSLISGESKFDRYLQGRTSLTPSEMNGYSIFNSEKGDCFHCHSQPLFTDHELHNIGLDSIPSGADRGHYLISSDSSDLGAFKTPTLRNVALRSTYMHDGRFTSLSEVVEHYNDGVERSSYLDPIMTKAGKEDGLGLTAQEKADLVAFLKTLSDSSFVQDPAFTP